jgi:hypothetical protein
MKQTPEEKKRLDRERHARNKAEASPEALEAKKARDRNKWHEQTPEQREAYNNARAARYAARLAKGETPKPPKTPNQKQKARQKYAAQIADGTYKKQVKTPEQRAKHNAARNAKRAADKAAGVAVDFRTPEATIQRNATRRIRMALPDGKAIRNRQYKKAMECPVRQLAATLRSRIRTAVKTHKYDKRSLELLGAPILQVRAYLEANFLPGMTWDNHGYRGWHIDHIRPVASFDLLDAAQQVECFHYTNMQPLWAADNLRKSAKWAPSGIDTKNYSKPKGKCHI